MSEELDSIANSLAIITIELGRLYDLMFLVAAAFDAESTASVTKLHKEGHILSPAPALRVKDDTSN